MHNFILRLCVILLLSLNGLSCSVFLCHAHDTTEHEFTAEDYFEEGYRLYTQSQFQDAAAYLEHAASLNHPGAQELYADICYRQLDDEPHSYSEAAMWYLLAASGPYADPDAASYLESILPGILQEDDEAEQIKAIVRYWCLEDTLLDLKPLDPAQVSNYIAQKYKREINTTMAQKLPYFLDKVMTSLVHCLLHRIDIPVDHPPAPPSSFSQDSPTLSSRSEQQQSFEIKSYTTSPQHFLTRPTFLSEAPLAFAYGPVYWDYWRALIKDQEKKEERKRNHSLREFSLTQREIPSSEGNLLTISPLYQFFLDALHHVTSQATALTLTTWTHREYPWLWAGIKFWKGKNPNQEFSFTSLSEEELLNKLETLQEIDLKDINKTLKVLENKEGKYPRSWPDKEDAAFHDDLHVEFQKLLTRYFRSPLSYQSPPVQSVTKEFYRKIKKLSLNCSKDEDLATLQTPILMYYCQDLTLTKFTTNEKCYNGLYNGQRYFIQPQVTIQQYSWDETSKYAELCHKLFAAIEAHGVSITIHTATPQQHPS